MTVELRPPTFERFFDRASLEKDKTRRRYKHIIEPAVTYRYVTGVNRFAQFVHFDSDTTLTNTSEVEYGFTQRLFRKDGDGQPQELISWRIVQKHYFDPTFGGAGTLLKVKPYREFFATAAFFRLDDNPMLSDLPPQPPPVLPIFQQPLSNQIRALVGYGSESRRGFNLITGLGYDFENKTLQNQIVQMSYNGGCCGLAVEYRRINLGQIRAENQFRLAFIIANIGAFGNLRHQEKLF